MGYFWFLQWKSICSVMACEFCWQISAVETVAVGWNGARYLGYRLWLNLWFSTVVVPGPLSMGSFGCKETCPASGGLGKRYARLQKVGQLLDSQAAPHVQPFDFQDCRISQVLSYLELCLGIFVLLFVISWFRVGLQPSHSLDTFSSLFFFSSIAADLVFCSFFSPSVSFFVDAACLFIDFHFSRVWRGTGGEWLEKCQCALFTWWIFSYDSTCL